MTKTGMLCSVMIAFAIVSAVGEVGQANDRWIVHLQGPPGRAQAAVARAVQRSGGKVLDAFSLIPAMTVQIPEPALRGLLNNPNLQEVVSAVEPDAIVTATKKPSGTPGGGNGGGKDKEQPPQEIDWGVTRIGAELAWDASRGGDEIRVCVIDTGIDKNHPDLEGNIKGGINFVPKRGRILPTDWDDDNGHGTHVAGTIAALDNSIGSVGVAPKAWLYAAKALNKKGIGYVTDLISAIEWAVANDMDVVNMSLSTSADVAALEAMCDAAESAGVVLVAAAGNNGDGNAGTDEVQYPAKYASVCAVVATDADDDVSWWSASGPQVELAAPGVDIRSTWKGGTYETKSGTSMATPHVTGVVALVLAAEPAGLDNDVNGTVTPAEVRSWLALKADDLLQVGPDNVSGHGLVDAEESATGTQTNP